MTNSTNKVLKTFQVSSKNLNLYCYPQSIHAFVCWHALFSQLEIQQREFTFKLLSDAKCEIPIIITDKEDTYLFTSHFAGIHGYFYDPSLKFKFKGYQNLNHNENILSALRDVLNLLESKQFKVISKLDVLANCLNQNYTSTQLHQVFGYNQLSLDTLREITKLSIRQSPASFPKNQSSAQFSLNNILNALKDQ